jgi:hypothetical protein
VFHRALLSGFGFLTFQGPLTLWLSKLLHMDECMLHHAWLQLCHGSFAFACRSLVMLGLLFGSWFPSSWRLVVVVDWSPNGGESGMDIHFVHR